MLEEVGSSGDEAALQKKAVEIAKRLLERVDIPSEEEKEEEEEREEESKITRTNLRNMLEAAIDCEKKDNWDLFGLRVLYIARKASSGDDLYYFVKNLLTEIKGFTQDSKERLKLARYILTSCIYLFNAYRKGLQDLVR
jgi:hypothetical protein